MKQNYLVMRFVTTSLHTFIHTHIQNIYMAPFQKDHSAEQKKYMTKKSKTTCN